MKKILSILTLCLVTGAVSTSCSDVVDLNPTDRFSPVTIWSSTTTADSYTIGLYTTFRDHAELYGDGQYSSPDLTDAYSDILKSCSWNLYNHPYNRALMEATAFRSTSAGAFECWDDTYTRIRRDNEFLRDAPSYGAKFGNDWIKVRIAEVRFCRAYNYYLLCRVYGGVILRTNVDGPAQNNMARSTEAECWDFIIKELQEAAADLPVAWDGDNSGRATKKAAYALLSRVALYAEKWDIAAQAADDAKTAGASLDVSGGYAHVFNSTVDNPEICFGVEFNASIIGHNYDAFVRPSGDTRLGKQVYSAFAPTSELVDSYEMADGSEFSWTTNGDDPYTGREPRFYATILYNGAPWGSRNIETFVGGADGYKAYENASAIGTTVTGYYLRKYLNPADNSWVSAGKSSQYDIIIRYAEVLLNKAEALAQSNWTQNRTTALAALNEVRARVNLPARSTPDKDTFMKYLRHERMIELAGEGFRYWDLRRWKLAVDVIDGQSVHGVKITKQVDGTFKYEQVDADGGHKRIFYNRYYKFAIPESERTLNPLCTNNDGWI